MKWSWNDHDFLHKNIYIHRHIHCMMTYPLYQNRLYLQYLPGGIIFCVQGDGCHSGNSQTEHEVTFLINANGTLIINRHLQCKYISPCKNSAGSRKTTFINAWPSQNLNRPKHIPKVKTFAIYGRRFVGFAFVDAFDPVKVSEVSPAQTSGKKSCLWFVCSLFVAQIETWVGFEYVWIWLQSLL